MLVLGVETSCDETSIAIVENGKNVLSNLVSSSLSLHRKYGGVIPEIASRAHLEFIYPLAKEALKKAKVKISDLGVISVIYGPGLNGSLLVGLSFAKAISFAHNLPLIGVDHIKAHLYAPLFLQKIPFPFIGLVVSGGHTSLFLVKNFANFTLLGRTVDDAAGEAFDKVAKILGLGYPGGPLIERLAAFGEPSKIKFLCGNLEKKLNFSFSGIKTAVMYKVKYQVSPNVSGQASIKYQEKANIAYAFQEAVFDDIAKKSMLACLMKKVKSLVVGGGVACNKRLRQKLNNASSEYGINVYLAEAKYCLDNAAMVAGLGYQLYKKGAISNLTLNTKPS
ncbi:MAG: tRNA (adenosine(37)-N6)-threonylcarbamoyltransferase complex transferase subunit TsaD [Candidatus Omnitrophota bacterium]|nr:tRNA (adenosine(37)-N6)-threonylcarbamoyltransferase complex transferase subunit TsaD [Candidatus Omnitrophota bacterium]